MLDYVAAVTTESDLFNSALQRIWDGPHEPAEVPVPSCPDWTAADLAWHLTEVQYFWTCIVDGPILDATEVTPLARPADDALLGLHAKHAARLAELLAARDPDEPCWSWYQGPQTVGWVRRRQAHEALIHRIDADLTADAADAAADGEELSGYLSGPIDEALATDGVDELLSIMLDVGNPPTDGSFEADGPAVALHVPGRAWHFDLGHLALTDDEGTDHLLPAIQLGSASAAPSGQAAAASVSCSAADLNLWLWRRSALPDDAIDGDKAVIDRLYEVSAVE